MPEELVEIFAEEAEDHLSTISDGLDRLRVDHNDMEAIGDIRRSLAYRIETLLNLLLEQERGATKTQVDLCLDAGDLLSDMLVMEADFDELALQLQKVSIGFDEQIEIVTAQESDEP